MGSLVCVCIFFSAPIVGFVSVGMFCCYCKRFYILSTRTTIQQCSEYRLPVVSF